MSYKVNALLLSLLLTCSSPLYAVTEQGEDVLQSDVDINTQTEPSLEVLETRPNPLYGMDGVHQGRVPLDAISPSTLKTFVQAVDLMRREYVEPVNDEVLMQNAISGMISRIDRNAEFLDEKAFTNLQSFASGNVASVGIEVVWQPNDSHWVVSKVAADSPAKEAGIVVGDYLHQIGDLKLNQSQSANDVAQLLSGIAGTNVELTYSKSGRSKRTVTMMRNQMQKSNIEVLLYNGIAVIKLPVFQNNTRQDILDRISHINTPVHGVILDLRNNPGGVLDAAVEVASLFMKKKVVTQVENRNGIERVLETQGSALFESLPTIVLQNRYSASAAEVLASSLQNYGRALVVGETSYGKGSVQSVVPIGNKQGIKLTTAHYLTPKGAKIDKVGVVPDVSFESAPDDSNTDWLQLTLDLMQQGRLPDGEGVRLSISDGL